MTMKIEMTQRGFAVCNFLDEYQTKCSIQESSAAEKNCIWLGTNECKVHHVTGEHLSRMHLTQEMVIDLIPLLITFAITGELKSD